MLNHHVHDWKAVDAAVVDGNVIVWERCDCGVRRSQRYDSTGQEMCRSYRYNALKGA